VVPDDALGLEAGQHRPHRGIAGRIGEALANVFGGRLAEPEEDVHDLALAARELLRLGHMLQP
jgi:hypothetical protein